MNSFISSNLGFTRALEEILEVLLNKVLETNTHIHRSHAVAVHKVSQLLLN